MVSLAVPEAVVAPRARPFLKWAGGKTQLLPEILARFPARYGRYHEPFVGGGAVFFGLGPRRAILSDFNDVLMGTYIAVRDELPAVLAALRRHRSDETQFYRVRAQDTTKLSRAAAAARMIYLNRTCFNGLYRVNKKGQFNVPFGKYKNPRICDRDNLTRVSRVLQTVDLEPRSALDVGKRVRQGDLVYFDPPYNPLTPTASFVSYTSKGFGPSEQERLAELFAKLAHKGAHVVLSNSDTPLIRSLYKDFWIERVYARRAINSRADRRGPVPEVLISN